MKIFINLLTAVVLIFAGYFEGYAIPAFARKYNLSCNTCHAPAPRLKDYGEEFAGNGFVLKDQDAPRYYQPTGDDELSLIRDFPLAVRLDGYATYNTYDSKKADFGFPYNLKILSGGSLAENISYYFYFFLSERGEVAGIEDAYLMFGDLFGSNISVAFGQFQVSDPLFKREIRLTYDDYEIYKVKPGNSNVNLAYDRGIMISTGFETGTDLVLEVVNGNGIGHADEFKNFDIDKPKNFMGRLSQSIGDVFRVGGFAYVGNEEFEHSAGNLAYENKLTMFGGDLTFNYEDYLQLNLQYVSRKDEQKLDGVQTDFKTDGGFAELIIMPNGADSKWYGTLLYNQFKIDVGDYKYQSASAHLGYLLRRNIRLVGEFTHFLENEYSMFSLGFVAAF